MHAVDAPVSEGHQIVEISDPGLRMRTSAAMAIVCSGRESCTHSKETESQELHLEISRYLMSGRSKRAEVELEAIGQHRKRVEKDEGRAII